jgi:gamma-glutamylcyclotransferase
MDAHYDQVMRRRAEQAGAPPRLYFAYSTILDRAAFLEWRAQHEYDSFDLPTGRHAVALDLALVYDFPSRWWGGRVAGLAPRPGSEVHGVVFTIAGEDWPIIQHKEGHVTGMCVEIEVDVDLGAERIKATAFTTNPARRSEDGPISPRFVEALTRGARSAGLPESWIAEVARAQ